MDFGDDEQRSSVRSFSTLHATSGLCIGELQRLGVSKVGKSIQISLQPAQLMFDTYAEIFAERANAYHAAMMHCPRARDVEFRAVLEPLEGRGGLLCDMPSGGGYLAPYVPRGWRYLGIDPADDFIDSCTRELEVIRSTITNVPLADRSADAVVSLAGLHHEPDLPKAFREMQRILKPGGRAVLADVAAGTPPANFLNGFVDQNSPIGHEGHFLGDKLSDLLEETGFTIADDRLIEATWRFGNLEEAGTFCRQLFWMPSLTVEEVANVMEREIGFDFEEDRPLLRWKLRRIVCDVAEQAPDEKLARKAPIG